MTQRCIAGGIWSKTISPKSRSSAPSPRDTTRQSKASAPTSTLPLRSSPQGKCQQTVIPTALNFDTCPVAASNGSNDLGRSHQKVPRLTACIDNGLIGVPDPHAEDVVTQIFPDILGRVQLGRIGRQ